jgi:poly(3-hydroxybutyrate) depolymerase
MWIGNVALAASILCSAACSDSGFVAAGAGAANSGSSTGASSGMSAAGTGAGTSGSISGGVSDTSGTAFGGSGAGGSAGQGSGNGGSGTPAQDAGGDTGATVSEGGGDAVASFDGSPLPTGPSDGCGKMPTQALAKYVQHNIMVTAGLAPKYAAQYTNRNYYLWLPMGYDPMRKYPTVFLGHGCGGNGSTVLPIQNASTTNAILVGLSAVGACFSTGSADSPEIAFFDATLKEVESNLCVDKGHVFIAGFSSGSWLSNLIGCARAGIVRGQGNASGGLPPIPACAGPIAAILAHDLNDPANNVSGGMAARDRILKINGCSLTDTVPYDIGKPSMCVAYKGCPAAYPVVWCPTMGQGHSDQVGTGISVPGFWNFWKALP